MRYAWRPIGVQSCVRSHRDADGRPVGIVVWFRVRS
jgi:hypothetical protein